MGEQQHPLLIVSVRLLLFAETSPHGPSVFRRLANLTRAGVHLLLTAAEPDQWFPTRGNTDDVLSAQSRLLKLIQEAGGDFDGVYYVPRSMFTQDRKRAAALTDILGRYKVEAADATLLSSSKPFLKAAEKLGFKVTTITDGEAGTEDLAGELERFGETIL